MLLFRLRWACFLSFCTLLFSTPWALRSSEVSDTLSLGSTARDTMLYTSSNPLLSWKSYTPYAFLGALSYFTNDQTIRSTRNSYIPDFRVRYDDYLIYAPHAMIMGVRALSLDKGRSPSWKEQYTAHAISSAGVFSSVLLVKHTTHRLRPDGSTANSFPSGHTATAFLGAELFDIEYGSSYPMLSLLNYGIASSVGVMRILNNRHWASDVIVGAILGEGMAHVGYFFSDLLFSCSTTPRISTLSSTENPNDCYFFVAQNLHAEIGFSSRGISKRKLELLKSWLVGWELGYHFSQQEISAFVGVEPQEFYSDARQRSPLLYVLDATYSRRNYRMGVCSSFWSIGLGVRASDWSKTAESKNRISFSPSLHMQLGIIPWRDNNKETKIYWRFSVDPHKPMISESGAFSRAVMCYPSIGFSRTFIL